MFWDLQRYLSKGWDTEIGDPVIVISCMQRCGVESVWGSCAHSASSTHRRNLGEVSKLEVSKDGTEHVSQSLIPLTASQNKIK